MPVPDHAPRSVPIARISLAAIRSNLASLDLAPGARVGLAADALGHGAERIAELLDARGLVGDPQSDAHIADVVGLTTGTVPALHLCGSVLSVKALRAGEGVSYGYAHRATHDTRIALVVGGYAQGVVRSLGGRMDVTVAGERRPIVGRVAMDVCVVDIGATDVARADEVVFLGDPADDEPAVGDWAAATGLTAEEIVTTVGLRARREWF